MEAGNMSRNSVRELLGLESTALVLGRMQAVGIRATERGMGLEEYPWPDKSQSFRK
jgi:hypothetical protein